MQQFAKTKQLLAFLIKLHHLVAQQGSVAKLMPNWARRLIFAVTLEMMGRKSAILSSSTTATPALLPSITLLSLKWRCWAIFTGLLANANWQRMPLEPGLDAVLHPFQGKEAFRAGCRRAVFQGDPQALPRSGAYRKQQSLL